MILAWIAGALLAGSLVYCILAVIAALAWRQQPKPVQVEEQPITVMRPLRGAEPGLAANLRSLFHQHYRRFEVLLAVPAETDPAFPIAQQVAAEFSSLPCRIVVVGETEQPNGKVHALAALLPHAQHALLVMSDSDVRAPLNLLTTLNAELQGGNTGVVFCTYRASGDSFWTKLEALGMNTEFTAGIFTARLLGDLDFALGPTLAMRREVLEEIGGFPLLRNYLAEDFVIGNRAAQLGRGVKLSWAVIEHRLGSQTLSVNFSHRMRWCRSTRRSRPFGYAGLVFTNPLPLAILLTALWPNGWWAVPVSLLFRGCVAWATGILALQDDLTRHLWALLPVQDLLSFAAWLAGFFGDTINWRGRKLKVLRDGRFEES